VGGITCRVENAELFVLPRALADLGEASACKAC
jgi:hypothetical protein